MSDIALIICNRTIHEPEVASTRMTADCGHEVWAADLTVITALKMAEEKGVKVEYACLPCSISREGMPKPPEELLANLALVLTEDELNDIREATRDR